MPRIYTRKAAAYRTRITVPLTQAQREALDRAAAGAAQSPTEWARAVLVGAAV